MKPLYTIQLKKGDQVTSAKGSGNIVGKVSEIRETTQAGKKRKIYVIDWEDGAVERYPNGTVQISRLSKIL